MKICLYADPHWCTYSSIFRQRGQKYSKRLENLINSLNFVQALAEMNHCDRVMCLGDFHDRNNWNAEELSALEEVKWANIPQYFLVGNHEMLREDADGFNSTSLFSSMKFNVLDSVNYEIIGDTVLVYLPYMCEEDRLSLSSVVAKDEFKNKKIIVFSHNDLKMRYGMFESKEGYALDEIEKYCTLFINGHLHNSCFANKSKTILNLGNLTGQNFSEDGFKYDHYACILDTDTCELEFYTNPCAVYFYNLIIEHEDDLNVFAKLHNESIVSVKVRESLLEKVKSVVRESLNIIAHRFIITSEHNVVVENEMKFDKTNHLEKLKQFCLEKIGDFEILKEELKEVCK